MEESPINFQFMTFFFEPTQKLRLRSKQVDPNLKRKMLQEERIWKHPLTYSVQPDTGKKCWDRIIKKLVKAEWGWLDSVKPQDLGSLHQLASSLWNPRGSSQKGSERVLSKCPLWLTHGGVAENSAQTFLPYLSYETKTLI